MALSLGRRLYNLTSRRDAPEEKGGILAEFGLTEEQGNEIIMAARAHWFDDEDSSGPASEEAAHADSEQ